MAAIVSQRARMAPMRARLKARISRPGVAGSTCRGFFSSATPISGENRIATNQEATSAMATTAKIEKV